MWCRNLNRGDTTPLAWFTAFELIGQRADAGEHCRTLRAARGADTKVGSGALRKLGELGRPAELPALRR